MFLFNALIGGALLFLGRKVFWLFVGGAGFVAGLSLAARLMRGSPEWVILLAALVLGVIGALMAVFFQHLAIGLAGFLAGGYLTLSLLALLGLERGWLPWLAFLVGGIAGAVLVAALFDWAVIALSSLAGASLITEAFRLGGSVGFIVFLALIIVGVSVQAATLRQDRRASSAG